MRHLPSRTALEMKAICSPDWSMAVISSLRGIARLDGNPVKVIVPDEPACEIDQTIRGNMSTLTLYTSTHNLEVT